MTLSDTFAGVNDLVEIDVTADGAGFAIDRFCSASAV